MKHHKTFRRAEWQNILGRAEDFGGGGMSRYKRVPAQPGDAQPGPELPSSAPGSTADALALNAASLTQPPSKHQARRQGSVPRWHGCGVSRAHLGVASYLCAAPHHSAGTHTRCCVQHLLPEAEAHQPDINSLPFVWQGYCLVIHTFLQPQTKRRH